MGIFAVGVGYNLQEDTAMTTDDLLQADANLTHIAALKGRLEETEQERDEWRQDYERMAGAFELYENIVECQQALSAYAGIFYDVVLGALAERAEKAERQSEARRRRYEEMSAQAEKLGEALDRSSDTVEAALPRALRAEADAAEWEALYTAALVDLHRARIALVQIRNCEGMYEWLDKRHADGLGVTDIVWAAYVAGEALTAAHPGAVSLLTELEAAHNLITHIRNQPRRGPISYWADDLDRLSLVYDEAVKARQGNGN